MIILALISSILLGCAVVHYCLSQNEGNKSFPINRLWFWSLASVIGFGLSSSIFTPLVFWVGNESINLKIIDLASHALIAMGLFAAGSRITTIDSPDSSCRTPVDIAFWVILGISLATSCLMVIQLPFGGQDAMGIWNAKARVLALYGRDMRAGLKAYSLHPDYPLLLPGIIARLWVFTGKPSWIIPLMVQWSFTYACIFIVAGAIAMIHGRKAGVLAGMLIAGTPFFLREGAAAQQADVVLATFYTASFAMLAIYHTRGGKNRRSLILIGLTASLSSWTKNEGLLFLVALSLANGMISLTTRGWRTCIRDIMLFAAGALPVLVVVVWFKIIIGQPTDIFALQNWQVLHTKLLSGQRYLKIARAFAEEMMAPARWQIYPFAMGLWVVLSGFRPHRSSLTYLHTALPAIILVLGGYFAVYAITPLDLDYHIRTSLHRILLHLWPGTVLTFFVCFGHQVASNPLRQQMQPSKLR